MLGENLKRLRKQKGLSQEELAVRLNVVRQTVSKWEKNLSVPDADVLIHISEVLEVPISQILGVQVEDSEIESLTEKLAELNEELAVKVQKERVYIQAEKVRGIILFLAFIAILSAGFFKNEYISISVTGVCILAALLVLYRNIGVMTKVTTNDLKLGVLKIATIFNIGIMLVCVAFVLSAKTGLIHLSEKSEQFVFAAVISVIILFLGMLAPRLPFNRHTGLRLPWTVRDEDTWNLAHRVLGIITLPVLLFYAAGIILFKDIEILTAIVIISWIAVPGLISLSYFYNKSHT